MTTEFKIGDHVTVLYPNKHENGVITDYVQGESSWYVITEDNGRVTDMLEDMMADNVALRVPFKVGDTLEVQLKPGNEWVEVEVISVDPFALKGHNIARHLLMSFFVYEPAMWRYKGTAHTTIQDEFKVGSRVEILVDRKDNPVSEWKLGRIVGAGSLMGISRWHVKLDDKPSILDFVKIEQRLAPTHLKHSDAPMPDNSGKLTLRQQESGRFEPVVERLKGIGYGKFVPEITPGDAGILAGRDENRETEQTEADSDQETSKIEVGTLLVDQTFTGDEPRILIVASINKARVIVKRENGAESAYTPNWINLKLSVGSYRFATFDEREEYLRSKVAELDKAINALYDERQALKEQLFKLSVDRRRARKQASTEYCTCPGDSTVRLVRNVWLCDNCKRPVKTGEARSDQ